MVEIKLLNGELFEEGFPSVVIFDYKRFVGDDSILHVVDPQAFVRIYNYTHRVQEHAKRLGITNTDELRGVLQRKQFNVISRVPTLKEMVEEQATPSTNTLSSEFIDHVYVTGGRFTGEQMGRRSMIPLQPGKDKFPVTERASRNDTAALFMKGSIILLPADSGIISYGSGDVERGVMYGGNLADIYQANNQAGIHCDELKKAIPLEDIQSMVYLSNVRIDPVEIPRT